MKAELIIAKKPEPQLQFPILARSKKDGLVLKFTAKTTATVVIPTEWQQEGEFSAFWVPVTNLDHWEILHAPPPAPEPKQEFPLLAKATGSKEVWIFENEHDAKILIDHNGKQADFHKYRFDLYQLNSGNWEILPKGSQIIFTV